MLGQVKLKKSQFNYSLQLLISECQHTSQSKIKRIKIKSSRMGKVRSVFSQTRSNRHRGCINQVGNPWKSTILNSSLAQKCLTQYSPLQITHWTKVKSHSFRLNRCSAWSKSHPKEREMASRTGEIFKSNECIISEAFSFCFIPRSLIDLIAAVLGHACVKLLHAAIT